ncbi:transposase [Arachidicoccus rhizosphaerae]|nr:transposase [Arachidicoccus rhizosphaerae]
MKQKTTALNKAMGLISARINQVCELTKPQKKFLGWIFEKWIMLPVRHNFLNLFRYADGQYSEKSIRNQFSKKMNFTALFDSSFCKLKAKECIAAFDPSFIRKSGKKTFGKGRFWSGKDQRAKPGLEIGCLALVDVEDETAYSIEAVQTPGEMKNALMDHYVGIIRNNIGRIKSFTDYLAVDGYFMKKTFIEPMLKMGLQVITRMRPDANLQYLYKGQQKTGRGRKRRYAGKVDMNNIDKRRWKLCYEDDHVLAFELIVWCVTLKREAKVIYLKHKQGSGHTVFLSTDINMEGKKIMQYYGLRFQIEFLIRDAKQYTGLEECQAVSENKLYNHFNLSLMSVSLMKLTCWASLKDKSDIPFSMRSIKTWYYNKYLTETIFSNLGLELNCNKIKKLYSKCLNIGAMAA